MKRLRFKEIQEKRGPSQKAAAALVPAFKGLKIIAHFLMVLGVYIMVWKTQWKMCKTQKRRQIDGVTNRLCKNLRKNILAGKSGPG
ncbi:hypothetical protein OBV_00420 [Oscillibacter valericigenes Sjm18-20]|nr:hypothetical protein OBV_00420 [Oscillibacter valericigenes Sjm18-20]